jgi:hypothetical protein
MAALVAVGVVLLVVVSNPRSSDSHCVGRRTAVKTLSDDDDVSFEPVPTWVEHLRRLQRPARLAAARRSLPVEATTFRIRARLVAMTRRSDAEIDLVVAAPPGGSRTMSVGFEGTRICGHNPVVRGETPMRQAQRALVAACGQPGRRRTPLTGTAEIAGVGFFGPTRKQGAAPNGIELHPVLEFKSSNCRAWA